MKYNFNTTQEISLKKFKEIWKIGGMRSVGGQFSNFDKWRYLRVWDKKNNRYINNIIDNFDCGYVTHYAKAKGSHKIKKNPDMLPYPDDWDECYLLWQYHKGQGCLACIEVLIARNNHDGTVQLFREPPKIYKWH